MIKEKLMTYPVVKKLVNFYTRYASWFEELHARDYLDQLKQAVDRLAEQLAERVRAVTDSYRPLIDPMVAAADGHWAAFNQLPVVAYANSVWRNAHAQLQELEKLVQLQAQLESILRQLLQQADRLSVQVYNDVKVINSVPSIEFSEVKSRSIAKCQIHRPIGAKCFRRPSNCTGGRRSCSSRHWVASNTSSGCRSSGTVSAKRLKCASCWTL